MSAARPRPVRLPRRLAVAAALVFALALALAVLVPGSPVRAGSDTVVGSTATFWAKNWTTGDYSQISATARFLGTHAVVYVANGASYAEAAAVSLGAAFDSTVYPTLTSAYGSEPNPGVDGDARVAILIYDFHELSVDGSFSPVDIDPALGSNGDSPAPSNRREMFYLNLQTLLQEPGNSAALAAHEFAHLVIHYQHVMLDPFQRGSSEADWLQEGLAMYAEHLCGYDERASSMLQQYATDPSLDFIAWAGYREQYGAAYSFVSYMAGREGPEFIRELVRQPLDGMAGINAVLQLLDPWGGDFNTVFHDWVLAGFLDTKLPHQWPFVFNNLDVSVNATALTGALPLLGKKHEVNNYGIVYLTFPATDRSAVFQAVIDGEDGTPLHAALISWDSAGVLFPDIKDFSLNNPATGDTVTGPAGYDRHTLVVWSQGPVGSGVSSWFAFSGAPDPPGHIQFLDLGGGDTNYYPSVARLLERGVISGYEIPVGSGLWFFKGGNNVLRQQFAKMIMLAIGMHTEEIDNRGTPSFTDVSLNDSQGNISAYPYDFVEEAATLKIVNGVGGGKFNPKANITRGQLAAMIVRGAKAAGKPLPAYTGNAKVFADVPFSTDPDSTYMNVMTARAAGILSGVQSKGIWYFYPSSSATRNHVAKMTAELIRCMEADARPGL